MELEGEGGWTRDKAEGMKPAPFRVTGHTRNPVYGYWFYGSNTTSFIYDATGFMRMVLLVFLSDAACLME